MQNEPTRVTAARARRLFLPLGPVLAAGLALAACTGGATTPTSVPTIDIPTALPSAVASIAASAATAACVDAQTMGILNQLKAPGADVAGILASNKDTLIAGLGRFDPPDAATTAWRDSLVNAIAASDTAGVAAQLQVLANGGVTLAGC
jgi:hypothetical protein